jgi:hypothetical protein
VAPGQAIFRGLSEPDRYPTHGHAYCASGYRASNQRQPTPTGAVSPAEVNASRLLREAKILDRVTELQAAVAKDAKETVQKLVAELNQDRQDAKADKAHSAAITAVMGKAKLLGLVTDKHQDMTKHPDFDQATSYDDVGRMLLQSVGYGTPSASDVALALECHRLFTAKLEAIAERAGAGKSEH